MVDAAVGPEQFPKKLAPQNVLLRQQNIKQSFPIVTTFFSCKYLIEFGNK
jgi:hypothetical protein